MDKPVSVLDLEFPAERLNESRFTATIGSNQRDSRVQVNVDVDLAKDRDSFLVADVGLVEAAEGWRDFLGVGEHEDHGRILHNLGSHVYPPDGLNPRLDERSTLRIASELVNELLDVTDLVHLTFAFLHGQLVLP